MKIDPRKFAGYMMLASGIANLANASEGFFPAVVGFLMVISGSLILSEKTHE